MIPTKPKITVPLLLVVVGALLPGAIPAQDAESSRLAKAKPTPRTDRYGDPLPPRAVCRLGTSRLTHQAFVTAVAFSPDGRRFASTAFDGTLVVWEWPSGKSLHQFSFLTPSAIPHDLCFTADSRYLAGHDGKSLVVWDLSSGKEVLHDRAVRAPAFSPNNKRIAWLQSARSLRVRDLEAAKDVPTDSLRHDVRVLGYDAEGRLLIAEERGTTLSLRGLGSNKPFYTFDIHEDPPLWMEFTPDASRFALQTREAGVIVINPRTKERVGYIPKLPNGFIPSTLSVDGKKILLIGQRNRKSLIWEVEGGKEVCTITTSAQDSGDRLGAFSPDGKLLAMGGANHPHAASLWDTATGRRVERFPGHHCRISAIAFSPDGKQMATCASLRNDPVVRIWDCESGRLARSFEAHEWGVTRVSYTPDGTRLITCGDGLENVGVWDARTTKRLLAWKGHDYGASQLVISPDGERFASAGVGDNHENVVVWSIQTGKKLHAHATLGKGPPSMTFTPDGRTLIVRNVHGVRLWDMRDKIREFAEGAGYHMALSPDGRVLALVDSDKRMTRLLEMLTGQEVGQFGEGQTGTSVAFSPDGRTIALGSQDGKIRFFDWTAGHVCLAFPAYKFWAELLTFSPDGKRLASVGVQSGSATVLLWDVSDVTHRQLRRVRAEPKDIDKWCAALTSTQASSAYRAVWSLVAARDAAVSRLKSLMANQAKPAPGDVTRLIADLDSDKFEVREKAQAALIRAGAQAIGRLQAALKDNPSLEQRRRLELILETVRGPSIEQLLASRGVMVLEQIGNGEVWALLREFAKEGADSDLAREARLALQRRAFNLHFPPRP